MICVVLATRGDEPPDRRTRPMHPSNACTKKKQHVRYVKPRVQTNAGYCEFLLVLYQVHPRRLHCLGRCRVLLRTSYCGPQTV